MYVEDNAQKVQEYFFFKGFLEIITKTTNMEKLRFLQLIVLYRKK